MQIVNTRTYAPEMWCLGENVIPHHELPKGMNGSAIDIAVALAPVIVRDVARGEFAEPKLKKAFRTNDFWVEVPPRVVQEQSIR
jgi:ribosome maturation protein Sdo1